MTQSEQIIIGEYQVIGVSLEDDRFQIHHIRKTDGLGLNFNGSVDIEGDLTIPLNAYLRNRWLSVEDVQGQYQFMTGIDLEYPRESILSFISNYTTNLYIEGRVYGDETIVGDSDPDELELKELDMTLDEYREVLGKLHQEDIDLNPMDHHRRTMNWIAFRLKASSRGLRIIKLMENTIISTFEQVAKEETT